MSLRMTVRNTGSAPFSLDWPVAVALLDPTSRKTLWWAPLNGVDIRRWMPGEDWDSEAFIYRTPPQPYLFSGSATLPKGIARGDTSSHSPSLIVRAAWPPASVLPCGTISAVVGIHSG